MESYLNNVLPIKRLYVAFPLFLHLRIDLPLFLPDNLSLLMGGIPWDHLKEIRPSFPPGLKGKTLENYVSLDSRDRRMMRAYPTEDFTAEIIKSQCWAAISREPTVPCVDIDRISWSSCWLWDG